MGDVEVVGDAPEEDLLAEAMARFDRPKELDRAAGEFAARDVERAKGWGASFVRRRLDELVARGEMERFEAFDPQTKHSCHGYRWVEDGKR